ALDLLEKAHVEELAPALVRLVGHPAPEVRRSALERLETLGAREALPAVATRATLDPVPSVRAVALRAMCALGGEAAWAAVGDRRMRGAAAAALVAGGAGVVDVLAPFLRGEAAGPVAREAARILGRVGGPRAQSVLRAHFAYPDQLVRLEVLESLRSSGYAASPEEAAEFRRQLHEELNDAAWSLAALRDLPAGE